MSPQAICPACNKIAGGKTDEGAERSVTDHNRRMHDEHEVALVMPDNIGRDDLNELMDHASDVCNPTQYEQFAQRVIREENNFGVLDSEEGE